MKNVTKENDMTYEVAEKKAFNDTMDNNNITPARAVVEYRIALLGYGWEMTDNGPARFHNPGHQWGN